MRPAQRQESYLPAAQLPSDRPRYYLNLLQKDIGEGRIKGFVQQREHTHRMTYNFGYDYFHMREGDYTYTPIPAYLTQMCAESLQALGLEFSRAGSYENIIVSFYEAGDRLEPHMDVDVSKPMTDGKPVNFYFGEDVIGVVLEADAKGRFYLADSNEQVIEELFEQAGTVFLLSGKVRRYPYRHGVSPVQKSRVSVTFRTVHRL